MSPFGERLTQAMGDSGTTRKVLAAALGITVQAVGQAINDGKFSAANTARAARLLNVNWFWLATGEETAELRAVVLSDTEKAVLARLAGADPQRYMQGVMDASRRGEPDTIRMVRSKKTTPRKRGAG